MTHVVTDLRELREVVSLLRKRGSFAIDTETRGTDPLSGGDVRLDPRRNEVFWISLATQGLSCAVPLAHPHGRVVGTHKEPRVDINGTTKMFSVPTWTPAPHQLGAAVVFEEMEDLFFSDTLKIGHNLKFDLQSVQKYYDDTIIPGDYFCTNVAARILDQVTREYRLGHLVKKEFGFEYDKSLGARIEEHSFTDSAHYAALDAKWTWMLYRRYAEQIGPRRLANVWNMEMDVFEVLLYMEREGVCLDIAEAERLKISLSRTLEQLRGDMLRIAGDANLNLNSTPQLQKLFFTPKKDGGFGLRPTKKTKTGAPSTAKDALDTLQHPFLDVYREYQEVDKIHGTYLQSWLGGEVRKTDAKGRTTVEHRPAIVNQGRLHASFSQMGARTSRMSCSSPNLQNIPRPDENKALATAIRGLFVPPPGHHLIVADYGQIEYVVMAHLSRDPMLVNAFNSDLDLHQYVAAMVFGKPMEEITKPERTIAKNTNFAVAYGAGVDKIAAMSHISIEAATKFSKAHRKMMPTLYRWKDRVIKQTKVVRPVPTVTMLLGHQRQLPDINSHNWTAQGEAERQAVNTVVQGAAAEIIKLAMIRLHQTTPDGMALQLQVHDELVMSCPDDRVPEGMAVMREAMLGEGIQQLLDVPMKIDMQAVKKWSSAK